MLIDMCMAVGGGGGCRYATGTEWLTGSSDGSLALWTQFKKKPVAVIPCAHALPGSDPSAVAADPDGAGAVDPRTWIQSVAVAHNSDLAVSAHNFNCQNRQSLTKLSSQYCQASSKPKQGAQLGPAR